MFPRTVIGHARWPSMSSLLWWEIMADVPTFLGSGLCLNEMTVYDEDYGCAREQLWAMREGLA